MVDKEHLLTTKQMARFTMDGYLRFDELVGPDLSRAVLDSINAGTYAGNAIAGIPLDQVWAADHPLGQLVRHPKVAGIIESLVGPNCRFDHHCPHKTSPGSGVQSLHQDAEYDPRFGAFDIQLSFFPDDTTLDMGGTRFLPGSHFRRVNESVIGRYQHVKGMVQMVCKAGTLAVWHTNLWHGAQPNFGTKHRYMFKLRLNPMVKQQLLWNTDDLRDRDALAPLHGNQPWYGQSARVEAFNRIRFWRSLTGNPDFDLGFWMSRNENVPTQVYHKQRV